jgi:hypothetical protein
MLGTKEKIVAEERDEVYQIRLKNELKSRFMESCHDLALNPSAVMRMLMDEWTKKNRVGKKDSRKKQAKS